MAPDFEFESSDILGGALPVGRGRVARHSGFSALFKICTFGVCTLFFLLAFRHGRTFFLRWKERHYKLCQLDLCVDDTEFRTMISDLSMWLMLRPDFLRRIKGNLILPARDQQEQGKFMTYPLNKLFRLVTLRVSGCDESNKPIKKRSPFSSSTLNQPSRVPFPSAYSDVSNSRLRLPSRGDAYNSPHDEEHRVQHEAKLESDHVGHDSGTEIDSAPVTRKSKRVADSSDDGDLRSSQENRRDKRRRKASSRRLKKYVQRDDDVEMEVDESDVKNSRRAKKRDRTEVESTFGADDDINHGEDVDSTLYHHRVDTDYGNPRGKGRAFRRRSATSDTDLSAEDVQTSKDPLCKGRRIGEEWEAHGVQFRVGPDGQRLRKVLIKVDRLKFNMPVDSEHPDRSASVTAIVERWYTEEQYSAAKEAHELAWQDSDKSSAEPEMPNDRVGASSNAGKQLLWASTSNTGSPVRKIRISGHSSAIVSPRITLFSVPPPPQYARRVSSLYSSSVVKPLEMSPKLRPSRSYSKWEKQEIEAEAIARLRRKAEEKEKAKADAEAKVAEETKAALALRLPAPPTLAKSDEKPPVIQTPAPAFSMAQPPKADTQVANSTNTPSLFKIPTSSSDTRSSETKVKPENKPTLAVPAPSFSFSAAPVSAAHNPAPTPSGPPPSNPAVSSFFAQSAPPPTAPPPLNTNGPVAPPSSFTFGQTKAPTNAPIANGLLTPQGNGPSAQPRGTFSFPQPSNSTTTTNGSNSAAPPTGGISDSQKPKFNFGISSKLPSTSPSNPPAAPAPPNPPKSIFNFGTSASSSLPSGQPITNPSAPSTTLAPSIPSSLTFGGDGKSNGFPTSGAVPTASDIKPSEGAGMESRGQSGPKESVSSATLFGVPNGGAKAPDSSKPHFSFGAVSGTGNPKSETGKAPFTFGTSGSTPSVVPPTPGSVFSDSTAKSSAPIAQPLFGAPKNGAAGGGFTFAQNSTTPFLFGSSSFGSQSQKSYTRAAQEQSGSKKPSPPPPYGQAVISPEPNSLSGSVTARRIHALANDVFSGAVPSAIEEWINERSREELSSLLVRANDIIRDRERELSMTSELSKNLYHSNITLEKKHKALLARLPTTSSMTPRTTPSSSPAPTPEHQPTPLPYHRDKAYHTRRISVSPSDLALLADQNTELLQKLENLEAESSQANLAGRRRLGKLEKEIDVLREELDQYRTRSDALELQAERSEEEAKRRKQEWNERVKAHRSANSGSSWAFSGTGGDVRDFAPGSSVGGRPASLLARREICSTDRTGHGLPSRLLMTVQTPARTPQDSGPLLFPLGLPAPLHPFPTPGSLLFSPSSYRKVRELELTNEQILESQRDTAIKLHEAQIEAEGIRRLYAFLDEQADVDLEVVEDGKNDGQPVQDSNVTMRFQSLRRSINGDLRQFSLSGFGKGPGPDIGDNSGPMKNLPLKARKTVVGLFDTPTQQTVDAPSLSKSLIPIHLGVNWGAIMAATMRKTTTSRSSSLYDVFLSGPSAPSRPTTPTPLPNSQLSSELLPDELQSLKPCQDLEKTPQRMARKADRPHRLSGHDTGADTLLVRRHVTRHRPESGNGSAEGQVAALKPAVAQAAVQTMTDGEERNLALVRVEAAGELQNTSGVEVAPLEPKRSRVTRMVLEFWLWAQFIIVILVFLWAVTKLFTLWCSLKWDSESEWEGSFDPWTVNSLSLLGGISAAYFVTAAVASTIGFTGIVKGIPEYVRFYRDFLAADFTFCVIFTAFVTYASFSYHSVRSRICEEFSRHGDLMRDMADIGLSPENCEQWLERAVMVFVGVMFVVIVVRCRIISLHISRLSRDLPSRQPKDGAFQRIYLLPNLTPSTPRADSHVDSTALVYAPVALGALSEREVQGLNCTRGMDTHERSSSNTPTPSLTFSGTPT
ncbi:hypothetical protein EDB83DRAFT_2311728 [Lactarius deliciosus]|nr:hypothetical protein EDB83DRAFT_2311728 [Lactarius deliciosus]